MFKVTNIILSVTLASFLTACAGGAYRGGSFIPSPEEVAKMMLPKKSKAEIVSKSSYKQMTNAFLTNFKTSRDVDIDFYPNNIRINKILYQTDSFIKFSNAKNFYQQKSSKYLSDDVATIYKNEVKKRGNYYNIYKGAMNKKILDVLVGNLKNRDGLKYYHYDLDYAFIEFNQNNEIQSALVRVVTIEPSEIGLRMGDRNPAVEIEQKSIVFLKGAVSPLSMTISNSFFTDNLVKSFK